MATTWTVEAMGPPLFDPETIQNGIENVLAEVVAQMSPWVHGSDLSRFNRSVAGDWTVLPPQFEAVMRCALDVAHRSGGAFDPAAGAIVNAWGFGAAVRFDASDFSPPSEAVLAGHSADWMKLRIDDRGRLLQPGGAMLNLSAVAKGFAVDAVSGYLRVNGLECHLVEVGGELRGCGVKPDLQPWWAEIEAPDPSFALPATRVALHGLSVATSGDYRRFISVNGVRLPHTIDPRTRRPVRHGLASVSVVHESCMWADAWSTAMMVLGPEQGLALAEGEGIAALFRWRGSDGGWSEGASSSLEAMAA